MSFVKLAAVAAGALFMAAQSQAAILTNGDFEAPTAPFALPPSWDGSSAVIGGPFMAPNLFVASGADYIPCCGVTGSPGALANHFATFGAGDTTHAGGLLAQSFATVLGQSYSMAFDMAAFGAAGTQTLRVRIIDLSHMTLTALHDVTLASNNDLDTAFSHHAFAFTATGGLSQIRFENISPVTLNIDAALDNVAITSRVAIDAVPEPEAWVFLLAGFSAIGVSLRRRQAAAGLGLRLR